MVEQGAPASVTVNQGGIERLAFGRALGRRDPPPVLLLIALETNDEQRRAPASRQFDHCVAPFLAPPRGRSMGRGQDDRNGPGQVENRLIGDVTHGAHDAIERF